MLRRTLFAALVVLLAIALLGCTKRDPEFTAADQVAAGDRPEETEPDNGDTGNGGGAAETLTFVAKNIEFDADEVSVAAGSVTFELVNEDSIQHDVTIEELGDRKVVDAAPRETVTGTVTLEPGTYTFYCSVPGHRSAGMEGTLTAE